MEDVFRGYYKKKRVLVTGHTGFKGGWLSIWLKELGADVVGYSLDPPSEPNLFDSTNLSSKIQHVHGDILDFECMTKVTQEFRPEIIFHLAAQALVRHSYENPKLTFDTNVMGTVNVLEIVRTVSGIRSIIVITSDKCYENREQVWGYKESDPMGGDDPYSASKGAAELVFRGYLRSFFRHQESLGAVTVRAGNVIGGGDWGKDRVVPDCMRALHDKEPIKVRNPLAVRPWQHVLEPLSGYLWLGARLGENPKQLSGGWNFGPADTVTNSVRDLVGEIINEWGSGEWVDVSDTNDHRLHEASWLRLSCDKAHVALPWSAILSFNENVRMTTKWYKYFYDYSNTNMYQFCLHQIREYTELAKKREQLWSV
ncbi:MAG: CDP-glucose 4,6-dehydratase [Ignavibacteriae bacterium]|nr:CDP-glucose 4,6-dehydratase [Ignavibacteria bacterium]MBI3365939.1 CDP-glucose 4,6-dehydratase [Ignavibacteriota bacterium]